MKTLLAALLGLSFYAGTLWAGETPKTAEEGVKVHGYWKIEVFEQDGTPVSSTEFQNALVGPGVLTSVIKGDAVMGGIYVAVGVNSGNGPCNNADCDIAPSDLITGDTVESNNLVVTQTGTNFETLNLSGSVTATTSTTIDRVDTWVTLCGPTVAPAACRTQTPDSASAFTRKTLTTGVSVTTGQIVQVTVQLTFS